MASRVHPRGPRPKLDRFRAGQTFFMPEGATWLNQDKPRPFVLATACDPDCIGLFVYGSSQPTELVAAAAFARVMPAVSGVNANGLLLPTYFFPGVMLPIPNQRLPSHAGTLGKNLDELKRALAKALGIGTGTCADPGAPRRSMRGRIVRLHRDLADEVQTDFGVVLTEHGYSRERRYQLIVPIVRGDGLVSAPSVLRVTEADWLRVFPQPATSALLTPTIIQSVWHDDEIIAETPHVIDHASLEALEARLCEMFGIEAPARG